jgi:hypothetical protein
MSKPMSERPRRKDGPKDAEESATPTDADLVEAFQRKKQGLPLTAREYLQLNYGTNPESWTLGAEALAEVPKEIRDDVQTLTFGSPSPIGSLLEDRNLEGDEFPPAIPRHPLLKMVGGSHDARAIPAAQNLPEDPAEAAIQTGLEADGTKRLH